MITAPENYKAWFEKYRPTVLEDIVFPNDNIQKVIKGFYDQEFINGNIISYGPPGFGKTTLSEVLIKKIVKDRNDIFILGRKTEDVDNLKRWLQQRPVASKQKIVKIEEMDRLSTQAQVVLKDGLMEKFQHNTSFLATTNSPEKIDPALITRFNTRINFGELPPEPIFTKFENILKQENIQYNSDDLLKFIKEFHKRGLRDLINNLELASINGIFDQSIISSFAGISGNEDLIVQYITYLVRYVESLPEDQIKGILKDAKSDQTFYTYYEYMLTIFKNELRLNWHSIYKELFNSDLDMSSKNIVQNYWQDLELKRFKHTHTIALLHDLLINILEQRGEEC
jgi:DNA polymerase III gamma/tau subunit